MIDSYLVTCYRGGFDADLDRSPAIFTDIGWVTLDSIVVNVDAPRSVLSQEFDSWLRRETWRAIDHLVRISASPADIWMCIEHVIRRSYAPWRPYAIAYAIDDIDLSHGVAPKRSPFNAFDRADVVFLDDGADDRIVVGIWTSTSIVVPDAKDEYTLFFALLPALQATPGVDPVRFCLDSRLSNVIRYDDFGVPEISGSKVVERIEWFASDATNCNGIWITRRPGRIRLTTGDGRRLDLMLNGNRPLFAPNLIVSEVLAPEATITPDSADGALLYLPVGANATTAMREAVARWVRHAASLAEWRHDVEEGINVAGDVCEILTTEIEHRIASFYKE